MEFTTAEAGIACWLLYRGYSVIRTERHPRSPNRIVFVFKGDAKGIADQYLAGTAQVEARRWDGHMRVVLAYLREGLRD